MSAPHIEIKCEVSKRDGYACIYVAFAKGTIHRTIEVSEGVAADVDEGNHLLGVEFVRCFSPTQGKLSIRGRVDIDEIRSAIEAETGASFSDEFERLNEAAELLPIGA